MARPARVPVNRARSESVWKQDGDPDGDRTAVTASPEALKLPSSLFNTPAPPSVLKLQFGPEGVKVSVGVGAAGGVGAVGTGEPPSEPPPQPLKAQAITTAHAQLTRRNILFMVRRSIHA
jgi:hypothetical protein